MTLRPNWVGSLYVLVVAAVSSFAFISGSTSTILLAALLALPSSMVAMPAYYIVYGILALVPGANPSISTGSSSCSANGACHGTTTGDAAAWFTYTTHAVGLLALPAAALLNVIVIQNLIAARRARAQRPAQPPS